MTVRCRLNRLLEEKMIAPKQLAQMTGLPLRRVMEYCDENIDGVSLGEVAAIVEALNCGIQDFFEMTEDAVSAPAGEDNYAGWDSHCDASADGKHDWHKDFTSSNSVYMEFRCVACGRRTHLIW